LNIRTIIKAVETGANEYPQSLYEFVVTASMRLQFWGKKLRVHHKQISGFNQIKQQLRAE
jgi:hypothetical protein